jgi:hypothetical protein
VVMAKIIAIRHQHKMNSIQNSINTGELTWRQR